MIKAHVQLLLVVLIMLTGLDSMGAKGSSEKSFNSSDRMKRRAGAYLGLIGDPFPTILGANIAYNITDFMRATAGFGKVTSTASFGTTEISSSATTIGTGLRFMVPEWNFTPVLGMSFAYVSLSSESGASISVQNFDESGTHFYGTLGFDWQASNGFNVALGYNLSFKSGIGGAPYLNLGWFFDLA